MKQIRGVEVPFGERLTATHVTDEQAPPLRDALAG
jgi:hypothetical protein